jgi:hypothetical protein
MPLVHSGYMLDTTVFNDALDGKISSAVFAGRRVIVTCVQAAELRATKNTTRQAALVAKFEEIKPTLLPASSFAFGIEGAGWDQAEWNDGSGNFGKMRDRLRQLDKESRKKIFRVADTAFTHGEDFCSVWHLFDLLPEGAAGWQPKFSYAS